MRWLGLAICGAAAVLTIASPLAAHDAASETVVSAALSPSAREAAVAVDAFHSALRRGDTQAAAALLADDALIFEEGAVERTRGEYAASHLPADAEFSKAVSATLTRRAGRSDGATAWIASERRTTGTFRGRPIDSRTTETMILRRIGDAWKIVHIHWSSASKGRG